MLTYMHGISANVCFLMLLTDFWAPSPPEVRASWLPEKPLVLRMCWLCPLPNWHSRGDTVWVPGRQFPLCFEGPSAFHLLLWWLLSTSLQQSFLHPGYFRDFYSCLWHSLLFHYDESLCGFVFIEPSQDSLCFINLKTHFFFNSGKFSTKLCVPLPPLAFVECS